jgi:hypothetical protein
LAHAVRAFLGLAGYYRCFIRDYGSIATPWTWLLFKEGFRWCVEAKGAFLALQRALTTTPILQLLAFDQEFVVEYDASKAGFSAVLHQGHRPVAFFSKPIAPHHVKLTAYERELIRLVQAVKH